MKPWFLSILQFLNFYEKNEKKREEEIQNSECPDNSLF